MECLLWVVHCQWLARLEGQQLWFQPSFPPIDPSATDSSLLPWRRSFEPSPAL